METLLAAIFVIFLLVFGVLTLSDAFIMGQETMQVAWSEMEARRAEQFDTQITILDAYTSDFGSILHLTLANKGEQPLMDFDQWDFIAQYDDTASYHIDWLPYASGSNAWTTGDISLMTGRSDPVAEIYNRGILDPGESVGVTVRLASAALPGTGVFARIITANGAGTTAMFLSNSPPELVRNAGLTLEPNEIVTVSSAKLLTTDDDDDDLSYTIVTPPTLGTLSLTETFTPADIYAGLLFYRHEGAAGLDGFDFTITDGKDTLGPYTFSLTIVSP